MNGPKEFMQSFGMVQNIVAFISLIVPSINLCIPIALENGKTNCEIYDIEWVNSFILQHNLPNAMAHFASVWPKFFSQIIDPGWGGPRHIDFEKTGPKLK